MPKTSVFIKRCADYTPKRVEAALREGIGALGSITAFIHKGDRVLLKPNMLTGEPAEKAVNTHPAVVESVARLVLEAGGIPVIGDSPMNGSARQASARIGYTAIAARLGIQIVDFNRPTRYDYKQGKVFKSFEVDATIKECDKIINLAKLKTHSQMYVTLCVKNMFGAVVGREKLKWHYIAGRSYAVFARILLDLYCFTAPVLNILDGIEGMQGYGPFTGTPRKIGVLLGGSDGVAVDRVACEIIGADHESVPILRASEELGVGVNRLEEIALEGDDIASVRIKDFSFPQPEAIDAGSLPSFVKSLIKDSLTPRPVIAHNLCRLCRRCIESCPAEAMQIKQGRVRIDYRRCIRCFCCIEACPYAAVKVKRPVFRI